MSQLLGRTASRDEGRTLPRGETVGRYSAYLEAQKAVDYLADNKFPVQRVSIIGNDLKTVERVTGRLSYPRVAFASAATGAWFGFFVGLMLTLFGGGETYVTLFSSMALGATFWMLFGVVTYAFQRGKRDFTSTSQVVATSYDVIVEPSVAADARRQLMQLPMNGQSLHPGASGGWAAGSSSEAHGEAPPGGVPPVPGATLPPSTDTVADTTGAGVNEPGVSEPVPPPSRGRFPDLPDGRPQYGIRVQPEAQPDGPSEPEQAPEQQDQHSGPKAP